MSDVVRPRALTYSGTFHQWFSLGVFASRTLPTIWVQSCRVSRVADHSATGSDGHRPADVAGPATPSSLITIGATTVARRGAGCPRLSRAPFHAGRSGR